MTTLNATAAVAKYHADLSEFELKNPITWIMDTEADGLLREMTHFHCLVFKKYNEDLWYIFCDRKNLTQAYLKHNTTETVRFFDTTQVKRFLSNEGVINRLVCHNILGYDLPAMQKFLGIDFTIGWFKPDMVANRSFDIVDSLVWSRYLNPERRLPYGCPHTVYNPVTKRHDKVGAHGLMSWGYRTHTMKPEVHDWRNQPLYVYINRCVEDVKINEAAYTMLRSEAGDSARNSGNGTKGDWKECLHIGKNHYHRFCQQERDGANVDIPFMEHLRDKIDTDLEELASIVEPQLPLRKAPDAQQPKFPAKPFKKDGSLSASGNNWFEKWIDHPELYVPVEDQEGRKAAIWKYQDNASYRLKHVKMIPMEVTNQKDIKEFLAKQGWKPTIWNSKSILTDSKKVEYNDHEKRMNAVKYIMDIRQSPFCKGILEELEFSPALQKRFFSDKVDDLDKTIKLVIKAGRFLPSTPKLKDQVSGKLCENLMLIDSEIGKNIVKYMSMGNRRSVIQARGEGKTTGWLNNDRLVNGDGRLGARSSGLTNTHRQKHAVVVNVPKADPRVLLGQEMRSVFTAPAGYWNIGWDAAALENRVGGHFCFPFDEGEYAKMMLEGDCHTEMADAYTAAAGFTITRSAGKNVTYGTMYGAQAKKLSKMLGVPLAVGKEVFEAFWNKNKGLKLAKEALIRYWESVDKKYIVGIDGSKVFTRSQHSLLNCLFQHAGAKICAYAFCAACAKCDEEGLDWQRWGEFHDEMQTYHSKEEVEVHEYALDAFGEPTLKENGVDYNYVLPPMEHDGKIFTKAKVDLDKGVIVQYYSRVGEIGVECMREAGLHYNLNLPLDADYMVGANWKECH